MVLEESLMVWNSIANSSHWIACIRGSYWLIYARRVGVDQAYRSPATPFGTLQMEESMALDN